MSLNRSKSSLFPDLPRDGQVSDKEYNLTTLYSLFFENLITALQTNFKKEGFVIPQLSTDQINLLTQSSSYANIVYDKDAKAFKGNVDGVWKTFTLS